MPLAQRPSSSICQLYNPSTPQWDFQTIWHKCSPDGDDVQCACMFDISSTSVLHNELKFGETYAFASETTV